MIDEPLGDGHRWLRICDYHWGDALADTFTQESGGRWNRPRSWRALYLNEDLVTARLNVERFIVGWPYEPEDLRSDTGPQLAVARLPRGQQVADVHTPGGVAAVGLPASYPLDGDGELVSHPRCQAIGEQAHSDGLRGIRCRSAHAPRGAGRELAWLPATARSRATLVERLAYDEWYWA